MTPAQTMADSLSVDAEGSPANPSAFPSQPLGQDGLPTWDATPGMTLRDWFAGQALAGLMANANIPFAADYAECEPSQIGQAAFDIADAMLAARKQVQS